MKNLWPLAGILMLTGSVFEFIGKEPIIGTFFAADGVLFLGVGWALR